APAGAGRKEMSELPWKKRYGLRVCTAGFMVLGLALATACGEPPGEDTEGSEGEGESADLAEDPQFIWAVTGADRQIHEDVARLWNENNPDQEVDIFFLAPTADEQRQAMFQDLQSQAGEFDVLGLDVTWRGASASFYYAEIIEDMRPEVVSVRLVGAIDTSSSTQEDTALPPSSNYSIPTNCNALSNE